MEKKFIAILLSLLVILSPISFAYELNADTETDLLEAFLSELLNIQYKVTGLAIVASYKLSPKRESFKIEQVECSTNQIRVLVKSESSSDRSLVYTIKTTRGTKKIFTQHKLESRESNWFKVTTNTTCSNLKTLQISGYSINGTRTVYTSTDTYTFTGSEPAIATQTTIQSTQILSNPSDRYTYVYLGNNLVERIDGNNNHVFFHEDHLGSTRLATDINGSKVSDNSYEPFGSDQYTTSTISNNDIKFTGKEEDKSGLYYFGARYYDPEFGRFTQIDPLYDPLESPYVYAKNNPLRFVDPTGQEPIMTGNAAIDSSLVHADRWLTENEELLGYVMPVGGIAKHGRTVLRGLSEAERANMWKKLPSYMQGHIKSVREVMFRTINRLRLTAEQRKLAHGLANEHDLTKAREYFQSVGNYLIEAEEAGQKISPQVIAPIIRKAHSRLEAHHLEANIKWLVNLPEEQRVVVGIEYTSDWFVAAMQRSSGQRGSGPLGSTVDALHRFMTLDEGKHYDLLQKLVGQDRAGDILATVSEAAQEWSKR